MRKESTCPTLLAQGAEVRESWRDRMGKVEMPKGADAKWGGGACPQTVLLTSMACWLRRPSPRPRQLPRASVTLHWSDFTTIGWNRWRHIQMTKLNGREHIERYHWGAPYIIDRSSAKSLSSILCGLFLSSLSPSLSVVLFNGWRWRCEPWFSFSMKRDYAAAAGWWFGSDENIGEFPTDVTSEGQFFKGIPKVWCWFDRWASFHSIRKRPRQHIWGWYLLWMLRLVCCLGRGAHLFFGG